MLKIRLKRIGRKNDPSFRIVLIDSQKGPKSGKINQILGFYEPRKNVTNVEGEEIKSWIKKGAQVSDTVWNILISQKVISGKKINVLPRKSPIKKEGVEVKGETKVETKAEIKEAVKEEVREEVREEVKEEVPDEVVA